MDRSHLRTDAGKEKGADGPIILESPAAAAVVEAFHGYGIRTPSVHIGFDHAGAQFDRLVPGRGQAAVPAIQQWMGQPVRCGTVGSIEDVAMRAATDGMVSFVHDAVFVRQDDDVESPAVSLGHDTMHGR